MGCCARNDAPGVFPVEVDRVIVRLLDLASVEVRQKHLIAEDAGVLVVEASKDGTNAGIGKNRLPKLWILCEVAQMLVGKNHVEATFAHLIEHGCDVVRDVFLELIKIP